MNLINSLIKISNTNLSNNDDVNSAALLMESTILTKNFPYLTDKFVNNRKLLKKLQNIYETFETNLEIGFAKDIVSGKQTAMSRYLLYRRFVKLIKNEIKLADIKKDNHVLFIGSGPLPISAILVNKFTSCQVVCVEKNKNRATISCQVLDSLGLSEKIKVINDNGKKLKENNCSVVIIALLAKPKSDILDNIFKKTMTGTRIVCRTSDGARQAFYEPTEPNILRRYKIVDKIVAGADQTISSVLLLK